MQGELQLLKGSWHLTLAGKFNKVAQKEFLSRIQEIQDRGYAKLELDLNQVTFINNSGLGRIAMTCIDLQTRGVQVSIVGISPKIHGMLDRHGLSDLLVTGKL